MDPHVSFGVLVPFPPSPSLLLRRGRSAPRSRNSELTFASLVEPSGRRQRKYQFAFPSDFATKGLESEGSEPQS